MPRTSPLFLYAAVHAPFSRGCLLQVDDSLALSPKFKIPSYPAAVCFPFQIIFSTVSSPAKTYLPEPADEPAWHWIPSVLLELSALCQAWRLPCPPVGIHPPQPQALPGGRPLPHPLSSPHSERVPSSSLMVTVCCDSQSICALPYICVQFFRLLKYLLSDRRQFLSAILMSPKALNLMLATW